MAQSGVAVHPICITKFNEMKLSKNVSWIVYKISDDYKEIVHECSMTTKGEVILAEEATGEATGETSEQGTGEATEQTAEVLYDASDKVKSFELQYAKLREHLLDAKSPDKKGQTVTGGRYAVTDVQYDAGNGEGQRSKLSFIAWVPDLAAQYPRMMYSSSKEALKRSLNGLAADVQANDPDDIELQAIITKVSTGR